ncbi:sulfite exporter TauE/SafE family protein [Allohahella marinimesophila]|uniref:Probable membrane transporter protein n=1 Tax=Allohahella marinimesophila TaxID=1054972 RepID=A0ABP7NF87_9GAMM
MNEALVLAITLAGYLAIGAIAGLLAGLFGIGGGLIIVPLLLLAFDMQNVSPDVSMHLAIGTSLATIMLTSMSSIKAHHAYKAVRWDLFRPMACGIVLGAVLGVFTASSLSGSALKLIIGLFALAVAAKMLTGFQPAPTRVVPRWPGLAGGGAFIGWGSAIFGIGGGTLTVPWLVWHNVRMQDAVATSAACGLPIAIAGALTNVVAGWNEPDLPNFALGFVYLPAFFGIVLTSMVTAKAGARLAHRLPAKLLSRLFACLLIVVGLRLLTQSF